MLRFSRKNISAKKTVKSKKILSPHQQMVRKQIVVGVLISIVIGLLLTAVWYGTRAEDWQIASVEVVGGFTIPHTTIEEVAKEELAGTYAKLIPKGFSPLFPEQTIIGRIEEISRVKNVHVEVEDRTTLIIAFEEYKPEALWCASLEDRACFFIDALGYAFAAAPHLSGGAFVRYINDEPPSLGEHYLDSDFIAMTRHFIEQLEDELSLFVTEVHVLGDYDIEYTVAGGGRIKVSQKITSEDSFLNLKTILQSEEFAYLEPGTFHYIDLRFGDKVFVSEVQDEEGESATSTDDLVGVTEE